MRLTRQTEEDTNDSTVSFLEAKGTHEINACSSATTHLLTSLMGGGLVAPGWAQCGGGGGVASVGLK